MLRDASSNPLSFLFLYEKDNGGRDKHPIV